MSPLWSLVFLVKVAFAGFFGFEENFCFSFLSLFVSVVFCLLLVACDVSAVARRAVELAAMLEFEADARGWLRCDCGPWEGVLFGAAPGAQG